MTAVEVRGVHRVYIYGIRVFTININTQGLRVVLFTTSRNDVKCAFFTHVVTHTVIT